MSGIAQEQQTSAVAESAASKPPADHREAVAALERELRARRKRRLRRLLGALVVLALGAFAYRLGWDQPAGKGPPRFVTAAIEQRDIAETVASSGKLRPVVEVQVGTQVSGRVVRVHVDFNSRVQRGDLLAEVDPSLFGAQVAQVRGQLQVARAQAERARAARLAAQTRLSRIRELRAESIASGAELDDANDALRLSEADVAAADAQIEGLTAQLRSANTTLAYTKIHSPIDGVVVTRAVDPGQTVASSFSAPVLFVIAQNLSDMQVLADVDEADVGKIREGMPAQISVDAFPGERFEGKVTQIRFSPTEIQGVVTYAAVLEVENEALKLRPGMTATVTITTADVRDQPAVKNAALRFKPKTPGAVSAEPLKFDQRRVYVLSTSAAPSAASEDAPEPGVQPVVVKVGISDGVWTAIESSELESGSEVVVQERSSPKERRRKFLGIF